MNLMTNTRRNEGALNERCLFGLPGRPPQRNGTPTWQLDNEKLGNRDTITRSVHGRQGPRENVLEELGADPAELGEGVRD